MKTTLAPVFPIPGPTDPPEAEPTDSPPTQSTPSPTPPSPTPPPPLPPPLPPPSLPPLPPLPPLASPPRQALLDVATQTETEKLGKEPSDEVAELEKVLVALLKRVMQRKSKSPARQRVSSTKEHAPNDDPAVEKLLNFCRAIDASAHVTYLGQEGEDAKKLRIRCTSETCNVADLSAAVKRALPQVRATVEVDVLDGALCLTAIIPSKNKQTQDEAAKLLQSRSSSLVFAIAFSVFAWGVQKHVNTVLENGL